MTGGSVKKERQGAGSGRPRDPRLEQRVREAALLLYADFGWSGFSLDRVARAAGVGKAALYLRWSSKEALLSDALQATSLNLTSALDTGALRGDLLALGKRWMDGFLSPAGRVTFRFYVESAAQSELFVQSQERLYAERIREIRAIVRRARERGEVSEGTSTTLVIDLITGAVLSHVMSTPTRLQKAMRAKADTYIQQLVDFVLLGIQAHEAALASKSARPKPSRGAKARRAVRPSRA